MPLDGRMRYARRMKRGLLLVVVVGCTWSSSDDRGAIDHPIDPGGPGRPGRSGCQADRYCSGADVCARTGSCVPSSEVYAVHVNWTVKGAPASDEACAPSPDLQINFGVSADDASFGFAPVPCVEGKFTVDKLPTKFTTVRLRHGSTWQTAAIDATTGDAVFDLSL
jgi:hypothetical protein